MSKKTRPARRDLARLALIWAEARKDIREAARLARESGNVEQAEKLEQADRYFGKCGEQTAADATK